MGGAPSKPDPTAELQVIGAGYSKTGTTSMQLALEKILDGPVMHCGTHILVREDSFARRWVQAYEARFAGDKERVLKLVQQQMTGYVGCTDMPNADFLPELLELYPNIKVVLVTRNRDKWWDSINLNFKYATPWFLPILTYPYPSDSPVDLLEIHNDWVRSVVPKDQLLVMELEEGWEPLCRFLGKTVPNEPFPQVNEAESADREGRKIFAKLILLWLGILTTTGSAAYVGYRSFPGFA
ncbi:P-loop containing nucleoside triphosphate hydrolase protein [Xylariales sp. PMI_506]|nr:P-loop containing nucleoside triphosphate hydrolase protein [Xylariales sp. PMI_506]